MAKKRVLISFVGTVLDSAQGKGRWLKWRPNIAVHQLAEIERTELFFSEKYRNLAEEIRSDVAEIAPQAEVNLVPMELANPWDFSEVYAALDAWTAAYPFDTENEEYWVHITTGTHVVQICLFLLVESRRMPAVLLQTAPPRAQRRSMAAGDAGHYEIIDLDLARYDALAARLEAVRDDALRYLKNDIPTRNPQFNRMIAEIEQVALQSPLPILLSGPTGSGKSVLARRIFELKKARHLVSGRFVDVNCATLRGDAAASALFGHKKGAFTGAAEQRAGWLKSADKGILFLDEIGDLGADEQTMLLKAIEEKRFYPVGSDHESESRFQLIAATNRDLRAEVRAGRFREDLFARINVWHYSLPALADRREDIEPNLAHQLALAAQELGRSTRFNREAQQAYLAFALSPEAVWTGNFRDLSGSVMRLATLARHGRIDTDLVHAEIERLRWQWREAVSGSLPAATLPEKVRRQDFDAFDLMQLEQVLAVCRRHATLSQAGRALFGVSRLKRASPNDGDRLRKYLARFGLTWADV